MKKKIPFGYLLTLSGRHHRAPLERFSEAWRLRMRSLKKELAMQQLAIIDIKKKLEKYPSNMELIFQLEQAEAKIRELRLEAGVMRKAKVQLNRIEEEEWEKANRARLLS